MKNIVLTAMLLPSLFVYGNNLSMLQENDCNAEGADRTYISADVYKTSKGDLKATVVGHGSLMFEYAGKVIHVDPYARVADYTKLPKADLVVISHEHQDHLDTTALDAVKRDDTHFIVSPTVGGILGYGEKLSNGEHTVWDEIKIDAVPAYNIEHKTAQGGYFHPKGVGNGYVFTFGDKRVYVAGDTENIPEMAQLKDSIDLAFLPRNLPFTMTNDMLMDAAKKIAPKILYPYHLMQFNDPDLVIEFDKDKAERELAPTTIMLKERAMFVLDKKLENI